MDLIRAEIEAAPEQRITFARFMERALTEPELGYYATSALRPTRGGDFLTAPELHPFFGRCVGRFVSAVWERAGAPASFVVHEYGAGRGTLRGSVLEGLRTDGSGLASVVEWTAIDLPGRGGDGSADGPVDLVVANEYLDALPVHRVVQTDGQLKEAYVTWRDGWFSEVVAEPSSTALSAQLEADGATLTDGQRAEVGVAAPGWIGRVAATAEMTLVVDYGHAADELYGPRRMAGSLLTYRQHRVGDDPFEAVGRSDITAHLDITALERAARAVHLHQVGSTTQAHFLHRLGLGELLVELGRDPATPMQDYLEARSAVARLVDPRHLGGFRVLAWSRSEHDTHDPRPLRGFDAEA